MNESLSLASLGQRTRFMTSSKTSYGNIMPHQSGWNNRQLVFLTWLWSSDAFRTGESLPMSKTHCGQFFLLLTKSYHFIGFKTCQKLSTFCSWPSLKESGSITDLTSKTDLHFINSMKTCFQSRLWRQIRSRPTPFLTQSWTKDAWFFTSFDAYKMARFVKRRKKSPHCASNRCRDSF